MLRKALRRGLFVFGVLKSRFRRGTVVTNSYKKAIFALMLNTAGATDDVFTFLYGIYWKYGNKSNIIMYIL